jgi:hypothetical protein
MQLSGVKRKSIVCLHRAAQIMEVAYYLIGEFRNCAVYRHTIAFKWPG